MNITQSHTICPDRLRLRLQAAALRLLRAQLTQLGGDQALLLRLRTSGETSETYGEIQHGSALSRKCSPGLHGFDPFTYTLAYEK